MNRNEIISDLEQYFHKFELVDVPTFNKYGARSWQFFDTNILHVLLIIRQGIGKPIIVNDWKDGGIYEERGLRTNIGQICKNKTQLGKLYLSGHVLGKAFDFKVKGMDSSDVRKWIFDNKDLMPCKVRLENNVSWVHIDTKYLRGNPKIYIFDV